MFGDRAIGAVARPGRTVRNGYANMDRWATHAKLDTSNGNVRWQNHNPNGDLEYPCQVSKLSILCAELTRCGMLVAGVGETHWRGYSHYKHAEYEYISRALKRTLFLKNSRNDIALLIHNKIQRAILGHRH